MRCAVYGVLVLLAGCVTTTEVVPAGKGTYKVSAGNDSCDCTQPLVLIMQQATEYCAKQSKTMVQKDTKVDSFDRGYIQHYTLIFSCVAGQ